MPPWHSPTHSKDSTVQTLPWTSCAPSVNTEKVNDSKQKPEEGRLWKETPTMDYSCVDHLPLFFMIQVSQWMWTLLAVKYNQKLLHGWPCLLSREEECCDAIYERPNCKGINVCVSVIAPSKMLLPLIRISFSDTTLSISLLFHMPHTVALDQRNIFKPQGAENAAGSTAVSQQLWWCWWIK